MTGLQLWGNVGKKASRLKITESVLMLKKQVYILTIDSSGSQKVDALLSYADRISRKMALAPKKKEKTEVAASDTVSHMQ